MRRFLAARCAQALWYSGFGVPLFVSGMMVSAFALRASSGRLRDGRERSHLLGWGRIAGWAWCRPALGAVVVLTTSTLNRVMVVELACRRWCPACWWRCTTWCR
jgi:hypothetical protein